MKVFWNFLVAALGYLFYLQYLQLHFFLRKKILKVNYCCSTSWRFINFNFPWFLFKFVIIMVMAHFWLNFEIKGHLTCFYYFEWFNYFYLFIIAAVYANFNMSISFICYLSFFYLLLIDLLSLHYYLVFESLIPNILIIILFNYFDLEFLVPDFKVSDFGIKPASAMETRLLRNLNSTIKLN